MRRSTRTALWAAIAVVVAVLATAALAALLLQEADPSVTTVQNREPAPRATARPESEVSEPTSSTSPPTPTAERVDEQPEPSSTPTPPTTPEAAAVPTLPGLGAIIERHEVRPAEPSGIAWSATRDALWIVTDDATTLTLVNRSGDHLETITIDTRHRDWEGVTELPDGRLLVVSETDRRILVIDADRRSAEAAISLASLTDDERLADLIDSGGDNKGLEGITVADDGSIWVVKEAEPMLLVQVDADLTRIVSWIDPTDALAAAGADPDELDLSGLAADPSDPSTLWIASHQAGAVFRWNTTRDEVINTHPVATPQLEGITFAPDPAGHTAFAVDDQRRVLLQLGSGR